MRKHMPFDYEASRAAIAKSTAIYRFAGEIYDVYMQAAMPKSAYPYWNTVKEHGRTGRGFLAIGAELFKRVTAQVETTKVWKDECESLRNRNSEALNALADLKKKHEEVLASIAVKNKEHETLTTALQETQLDVQVTNTEVMQLKDQLAIAHAEGDRLLGKLYQLIDVLGRVTDCVWKDHVYKKECG